MNKTNIRKSAIEKFQDSLEMALARHYSEERSRRIKAAIQANKQRLLSKAK